jgi:hypothetical protein
LFGLNLYLHNSLSADLKPQKVRSKIFFFVVIVISKSQGGNKLARSNYKFSKRQKELAKKIKKEQKRQRKLDKNAIKLEENPNLSQNEEESL